MQLRKGDRIAEQAHAIGGAQIIRPPLQRRAHECGAPGAQRRFGSRADVARRAQQPHDRGVDDAFDKARQRSVVTV